jgi:formyltetrahydrofolate-dependent phosphoribosylglycinamide formyltransferase
VARIVVLASGSGTNCQALLDATAAGDLDASIVAVVTNNPDAGVVARAEAAGVPALVVEHKGRDPELRRTADLRLIETVRAQNPDLVVLAGWMRILGAEVGAAFPIMNLHPAKPGELPGVGAIERAFEAYQRGEMSESGVMVHWVPDDGVDVGPVIASSTVPFEAGDTLETFAERMHRAEHLLIVDGARLALESIRQAGETP